MIKPNIPPNEAQRLKELETYQLIGTAEDEDFDFITTIAAQITNSKISLVSFVLEDMQWWPYGTRGVQGIFLLRTCDKQT